jgi:hypothetical protein
MMGKNVGGAKHLSPSLPPSRGPPARPVIAVIPASDEPTVLPRRDEGQGPQGWRGGRNRCGRLGEQTRPAARESGRENGTSGRASLAVPGGGSAASPSATSMRRTAAGSVTAPRIRRRPPQRSQTSTSIANTRWRRCAQGQRHGAECAPRVQVVEAPPGLDEQRQKISKRSEVSGDARLLTLLKGAAAF